MRFPIVSSVALIWPDSHQTVLAELFGGQLCPPKTYEFGSRDLASGNRLQSLTWTNPHWFLGTISVLTSSRTALLRLSQVPIGREELAPILSLPFGSEVHSAVSEDP